MRSRCAFEVTSFEWLQRCQFGHHVRVELGWSELVDEVDEVIQGRSTGARTPSS